MDSLKVRESLIARLDLEVASHYVSSPSFFASTSSWYIGLEIKLPSFIPEIKTSSSSLLKVLLKEWF